MRIVGVIQARTSSSRLPGKALLPVCGYPAAALAGLRAANKGLDVTVATSKDATDDRLSEVLHNHGIAVFRGPLDDVLARYVLATSSLPNDAVIVRLTADNVLPDGLFVQELAKAFESLGVEYLSVGWPMGRLPYGMFAELFRASALRKADAAAVSAFDREHVGPWMARNCKVGHYAPRFAGDADHSHLRCTIDDVEDYQRVLCLFEGIQDPLQVEWRYLIERLISLPGQGAFRVPYKARAGSVHSELVLGTAQLGMEYGIVNFVGKPSQVQAQEMVRHAISHGVTAMDTARSYGDAEEVLGCALTGAWASRVDVITKLDPMNFLSPASSGSCVRASVADSIQRSCTALRLTTLPVLLLHRWFHHDAWDGAAWNELLTLHDEDKIQTLGASVYDPIEALAALRDPEIRHLQIPINVLDRRWKVSGIERALADRPDVIVHARSAFLQGILLHAAERWPNVSAYDADAAARKLRSLVARFERESLADLCLAYVRSLPWIAAVVVGTDSFVQLEQNLRLFCLPKLTAEQREELEDTVPAAPDTLVNPSKWNLTHGTAKR